MIRLTPRLNAIQLEIDGETCADIGCDHGKLIVSCLKENRIQRGFAVDISAESLKKAVLLAEEEEVSDRLTTLHGDGFLPLKEKVSVAVIAGMGARETVHILEQGRYADRYILSPHQDIQVLRSYLRSNGYRILKDFVIRDKKYYFVVVAEHGVSDYAEDEMFLGKNLPPTKEFFEYVRMRKEKTESLYRNVGEKAGADLLAERKELAKYD